MVLVTATSPTPHVMKFCEEEELSSGACQIPSDLGHVWIMNGWEEDTTEALEAGAGSIAYFYAWRPGAEAKGNPYRGYLALADAFVVTGDSESILAEACSTGKPVYVYPLPVCRSFRLLRFFRETVVRFAQAGSGQYREASQRGGLEALCAWLISRGFVRPTRDLDLLHDSLVEEGVLRRFGSPYSPDDGALLCEVEKVAARVRRLMSGEEPSAPTG